MVLDELLSESKQLKSPEARVLAIEEAQAKLAQTETPSQLEELFKNPVQLLKLVGAGYAAMKGQPGLAGGLALGTLGKAGQLSAEKKAAKIEQQGELADQHEQAMTRIDKQQNRIANIMVANPDSLAGIDPVSLGVLITGREIPMDPTSKRAQALNTTHRQEQYELMVQRLGKATTDQDRKTIVNEIEAHMGWTLPDPVKKAMSREVDGSYQQEINESLMTHVFFNPKAGQTGLDAFQRAVDAGETDQLWKYAGEVTWSEDPNKISIPDETWKLIDRMNQWWNDPAIPMEQKLATGGDLERIADIVFKDEPGSKSLLQSRLSATAPWLTGMDAATIAARANGKLGQFGQVMDLEKYIDADAQGKDQLTRQRTQAAIQQTDDARRGAAVANAQEKITSGARTLAEESKNVYTAGVYIDLAKKALDYATAKMTDTSTAADFDRFYNEAIAGYAASLKKRTTNAE